MIQSNAFFFTDVKESSFTHAKLKATHTDTFSGSFSNVSNSCASYQFAYLQRPALPLPVYSAYIHCGCVYMPQPALIGQSVSQ